MANFEKKLEDADEKDLRFWTNERSSYLTALASDELTRRSLKETNSEIQSLNKTIKKANETSEKFTFILIIVAIIQLVIAMFQLFVPLLLGGSYDYWKVFIVEILFGSAIFWIMYKFDPLKVGKDKKKK